MKGGHSEAQRLFSELGQALGYCALRTWTKAAPTDGVWLTRGDNGGLGRFPVAALEVVVSEGVKAMRGSIATLIEVSPCVGIILLQDHEIRRSLIRSGLSAEQATMATCRQLAWLRAETYRKQQRLDVWSFDELVTRHELTCGMRRFRTAA
jgi:hypothetical protein